MIEFRKATVDDVNELARIRSIFLMEMDNIDCEAQRQKMELANHSYFEKALLDDSFVAWLATDKGEIIGTSGLSFSLSPPCNDCPDGRIAYIMNIFTFPDYRGQGLAKELFRRIAEEAKSRGYKKITLFATSAGKPLYEKYGFTDVIGDMVYYVE